jgi:hypothetical protein
MKAKIFTFWEPRNNIHGYLNLCLKTWKKYLTNYDIVILDYMNLEQYLGKNFFDKSLYKNYSLAKQADAIRCAVLERYGGIWLDLDTIITSEKFEQMLNGLDAELVMFRKHLGFIYAQKNATILRLWLNAINDKLVWDKTNLLCRPMREVLRVFNPQKAHKMMSWSVLGNDLLNPYLKEARSKQFLSLNTNNSDDMPECKFARLHDWQCKNNEKVFQKFYIENDYSDFVLENVDGIILLHNSWMPNKYKKLSEKEFLALDNTLSNLFKKIL